MPTAVPCQVPVPIVPTVVSDEVTTVALSVVPVSVPAGAALRNAREPSVPPAPIFNVDPSVPAKVSVLLAVRVFDVVPPATEKPVARDVKVSPLTVVGAMVDDQAAVPPLTVKICPVVPMARFVVVLPLAPTTKVPSAVVL